MVCHIPTYDGPSSPIIEPLLIELVVTHGEQCSKPDPFIYNPGERWFDCYKVEYPDVMLIVSSSIR